MRPLAPRALVMGPAALVALAILVSTATPVTATSLDDLAAGLAAGPRPVWVFLADKGTTSDDSVAMAEAAGRLSTRALSRRAHARPDQPPITAADLRNDPEDLRWLRSHGLEIRAESRWLGAVSVVISREDLPTLEAAPFIRRLQFVRRWARRKVQAAVPLPGRSTAGRDPIDYGNSLGALQQINVPALHELGYLGEGVVVGLLDSGFDLSHEALAAVEILGTWDFVNDDGEVADEPGDPQGQDYHGTSVLSVIAGWMPGQLVGAAPEASYCLAKTEVSDSETPIEEDYWVEGLEWLEAQGCDLVSSSLGYDDWYEPWDMDGNTCVTTVAADLAVERGLAIINAVGNAGPAAGTLGAPADGDGVIAIGAVDLAGDVAFFSSRGPTYDGRIKPDLCALGMAVAAVDPSTQDGYQQSYGTSAAAPLAAGAAALLLQARPGTGPLALAEALRSTASQASQPDNDLGWGVIDALMALELLNPTGSADPPVAAASARLLGNRPNPFNPRTTVVFALDQMSRVSLEIVDLRGRRVRRLLDESRPAGLHTVEWDGRDEQGLELASGLYLVRLVGVDSADVLKIVLAR